MKLKRREFLKKTTTGAAGMVSFTILPASVIAKKNRLSPSDKLHLAAIGVGGRGWKNIVGVRSENIVALCDVDWGQRTQKAFTEFPDAKRYKDYRIMFDKQKDIDGVVISTPDHTHAVIAMEAMKRGIHVYLEKPLAHSLYETRMLTEAAFEYGVQTQMGNQGHSTEETRNARKLIIEGAIGEVCKIISWSDRLPPRLPNGQERPEEQPAVPDNFDWDLWLGPAQVRPYHPLYVPTKWRSWIDFGAGAIADIGCHTLDLAYWALDLGSPVSVEASTTFTTQEAQRETFPVASIIRYEFPEREKRPAVSLEWYDGFLLPETPEEFRSGADFGKNGTMLVGDKGKMIHSFGAMDYMILPEKVDDLYLPPKSKFPESPHFQEWIDACKGGKPTSSNFSYGGPLTEMVLVGSLATRLRNRKLFWDSKNLKFTNDDEANQLINPAYREGWSL